MFFRTWVSLLGAENPSVLCKTLGTPASNTLILLHPYFKHYFRFEHRFLHLVASSVCSSIHAYCLITIFLFYTLHHLFRLGLGFHRMSLLTLYSFLRRFGFSPVSIWAMMLTDGSSYEPGHARFRTLAALLST